MSWTKARTELLKKLWADGFSASQCASELGSGISRSAILGKVCRLGLAGRRTVSVKPKKQRVRNTPFRQHTPIAALPPAEISAPILLSTDHLCLLFDLDDKTCRWPVWSEGATFDEQHYCGIPTADVYAGRPYCAEHSGLVYAAPQSRKGRPYWVRNGKAA